MGSRVLVFKPSQLEGWPALSFTPVSLGLWRTLRVLFQQVPCQLVLLLLPECLHFSGPYRLPSDLLYHTKTWLLEASAPIIYSPEITPQHPAC